MTDAPPKLAALGLTWSRRKNGWEARWRARRDLVKRGYETRSVALWVTPPPPADPQPDAGTAMWIVKKCDRLQAEMLTWGRGGGIPEFSPFTGTWRSLVECYQADPISPYRKCRHSTRLSYDGMCKRIIAEHGDELVADVTARLMHSWHQAWSAGGKVRTGHGMMVMLRTLAGFGALFLEGRDAETCAKARGILSAMRFEMSRHRNERMTAEQATAIRAMAHAEGLHSLALAQAFQFEGTFRQKDVIGEWVPASEPGISEIVSGNDKWLRGLRWSEIDDNLVLRHITSKKQKKVEVDLKLAPMVLEELNYHGRGGVGAHAHASVLAGRLSQAVVAGRDQLPATGPVVIFEKTGLPYTEFQFRRQWRRIATKAGVPTNVWNMDSRAGAISEALLAGAPIDHVRHAATHSNISTTQGYDRAQAEATAQTMRTRVEHRNKPRT